MTGRILLLAVMICVGAIALSAGASARAAEAPRMTIEELKTRLDSPDLVLIDVRAAHDWNGSKSVIKGAVREDPSRIGEWVDKYPKGKTIVLYCA